MLRGVNSILVETPPCWQNPLLEVRDPATFMTAHRRANAILAYIVGAALLVAALYLSFELGRYRAGYAILDAQRQAGALEALIAERDATIEDLRRQEAILETTEDIDRETYSRIEETLDELQAKIQAQEEELAFYRGIVSPGDGVAGLRIQDFEIVAADAEQRHMLRLILVQAIVHNQRVKGAVKVRFTGVLDTTPAAFDLAQLVAEGEAQEIAYDFRYFQSIEQALVLPVGFEPATVEVEIWPREPRGERITRSFEWAAVTG
jgi:hypothetical protein